MSKLELSKEQEASILRGSLLEFTRLFYKHLTGKDYIVSNPVGRESHHIIVSREYTKLFREQKQAHGLILNLPPGYGKSVMTSMWVAWCYAHYPDCNFLYISYSHELAASHTSFIKQIMTSRMYQYLFDVSISSDTRAKDHFMTTRGGSVAAFGSAGAVTGRNAGSPGLDRFSGCVIIDDAHKPNEIHSTAIRESVIRNYTETILQRPRDTRVPIVFIGQRLHEEDLAAYLMSGKDVRKWDTVILKGIDDAENALYPEAQSLEYLKDMREKQPFVFSSQIQQDPIPAGGSLFKPNWFELLDDYPHIQLTFITADTAETDKSYNDATCFSFWGLYEIETMGRKTGVMGLHWIDCTEIRVEPKDLKDAFLDFWQDCMRFKTPPSLAAIEKKSTGVTLTSVLSEIRGMQIRAINRTRASGSKTERFLTIQPFVASRQISISRHAKHVDMVINHMSKITANNTHKNDDIADTLVDAINIALIDKTLNYRDTRESSRIAGIVTAKDNAIRQLKDW